MVWSLSVMSQTPSFPKLETMWILLFLAFPGQAQFWGHSWPTGTQFTGGREGAGVNQPLL